MKNRQTAASDLEVRSLKTPAELEAFFRLNAEIFRPDEDADLVSAQRRRFLMDDPDFYLHQLRGAFLGGTYVGGYAFLQRTQLTVIKGLLQRSCRMLFASQKASSMPCCSCMDWPTSTSSLAISMSLKIHPC